MRRKKTLEKTEKPEYSILNNLKPIIGYLLKIEHNPISEDSSSFTYTMGFPYNWVLKSGLVDFNIIRKTDKLLVVEITPYNPETNVDVIYSHIIEVIEKNIKIDEKRIEYQNLVDNLKNKFEVEQKELLDGLFEDDTDEPDDNNENLEENV
jgi:translation elongation factor EF-1beta